MSRQRLDSPQTGTGMRGTAGSQGTPEGQGGVGAPRAGREGEPTPGLGSSPFRPLLSLVRTGRCPVPTARAPPSLLPWGLRKDVGKRENQRLVETEMLRDTETDTKGKGSVKSEH